MKVGEIANAKKIESGLDSFARNTRQRYIEVQPNTAPLLTIPENRHLLRKDAQGPQYHMGQLEITAFLPT